MGHRHFSPPLNDNAGEANLEGLAGFGVARGAGGTYTVMNVADEAATTTRPTLPRSVELDGRGRRRHEWRRPRERPVAFPERPVAFPERRLGPNGGLIAAIAVVATLLIAFATWQHALFDPEGFSARIIKAAVGAERFLAAYRAPRSWRRCSCLVPPAPEEENEAQERRGFFGLFKRGEHVEKEATK